MVYHLLIIIFILLLFILINKKLDTQENFDTYFLPFYNVESNLLRDFYVNDDNNKNYFKHKLNYNEVYIFSNKYSYSFFKKFNSKLLKKSLLYKTKMIELDNYDDNLKYLSKYDNSITNVTLPIILKDIQNQKKINLVARLHNIYLLSLKKLKYNINNIKDIPFDAKIGILNKDNTIYYYYDKIFKDLNIDYKKSNIIIYNSRKELYNDLLEDKIKVSLFFSELPNAEFDNFLDLDFMNEVIILPFDVNNQLGNLFFKKNDFSELNYFNLNKINKKYLPKKFGNNYHFVYKPTIKLLKINSILVCNNKINTKIINEIFSFLIKYRNTFRNTPYQIDVIEPTFDLIKYIPYQKDILSLFRKNGYITNIDSPNCKYFVGKKECTQEVLKNNGMD